MGPGSQRERGGLRVLASTAPSMVRALQDAAVEILTSESEAIPLDDDELAEQQPMPAVTGRRAVQFRNARVRATTHRTWGEHAGEVVGFDLVFGDEPRAAAAPVDAARAEVASTPTVARRAAEVSRQAPDGIVRRAVVPRRWAVATVVAAGALIGGVVALAGTGGAPLSSPAPVVGPAMLEAGPAPSAPAAEFPKTGAPLAAPVQATAVERVTPPAAAEPRLAPAASTPPETEAEPARDPAAAASAPTGGAQAATRVVVAALEGADATAAAATPAVDAQTARLVKQREDAYQREFERKKHERLKVQAVQAEKNREATRERQRWYKAEFERKKQERLEALKARSR